MILCVASVYRLQAYTSQGSSWSEDGAWGWQGSFPLPENLPKSPIVSLRVTTPTLLFLQPFLVKPSFFIEIFPITLLTIKPPFQQVFSCKPLSKPIFLTTFSFPHSI